jgi:predicted TIM-barrel fold metal-dependent hydrolase
LFHMIRRSALPLLASLLLASCAREPSAIDPQLAVEIAAIKAIDNHAHPVLPAAGDKGYDQLPVENLEPQTDEVAFRPGNPAAKAATQALYGAASKAETIKQKGDAYPAWVLEQCGIETMFANRVAMGAGIQKPRFQWVPYVDSLIFPLDNSALAARNSDRKAFFALLAKQPHPPTLADYTSQIVTPTLERHRQGGAIAEKFEAAYLRDLSFRDVDEATAARAYSGQGNYRDLQDYLFRYIAKECGRLGMAVHIHTMAGAGGYFEVAGANPLLLEPLFNDPALRKTNFVMVHGGWPFVHEAGALLTKPNAYLDISAQTLILPPATVAQSLHEWLAITPEKVLFGTDAYPYSPELGWEEGAWLASKNARQSLGIALTQMLRNQEITHQRAIEIARLVLRENAKNLYHL